MTEYTISVSIPSEPGAVLKLGVLLGQAGVQRQEMAIEPNKKTGDGSRILRFLMPSTRADAYKVGIALGAAGLAENEISIAPGTPAGVPVPAWELTHPKMKGVANIASDMTVPKHLVPESIEHRQEGLKEGMRTLNTMNQMGITNPEQFHGLQESVRLHALLPKLPPTILGRKP